MEKIKVYKVGKKGKRGLTVTIPQVWSEDNNIDSGTDIAVYRGRVDGVDALILMKGE